MIVRLYRIILKQRSNLLVIPAKAGIQSCGCDMSHWIPDQVRDDRMERGSHTVIPAHAGIQSCGCGMSPWIPDQVRDDEIAAPATRKNRMTERLLPPSSSEAVGQKKTSWAFQ